MALRWLGQWVSGAFDWFSWFKHKEAKILFLGLDNAGKTTLLAMLKDDQLKAFQPTIYPTMEELKINGIVFRTFDLGGHMQARHVWKEYYVHADAIIFLVDATDVERFPEAAEELNGVLCEAELSGVPVLVLGNKIDKPAAVSEEDLCTALRLELQVTGKDKDKTVPAGVRPLEIYMCSILQRQGYSEGFAWVSKFV